jgi:3'(2'), 5'-bisphosphate nucleotidase
MVDNCDQWLTPLIALAKKAGDSASHYYQLAASQLQIAEKADHTFVTIADLEAHHIIQQGLQQLTPDISILSEEGVISPWLLRQHWSQYWLTDPIDGTRGFIEKCDEFTVNIALIDQHQPVLGVVYAPALKTCYFAVKEQGAYKQIDGCSPEKIHTKTIQLNALRVLLGRYLHSSRLPDFFSRTPGCEVIRLNSSLKFCWMAAGLGDVYPRLGQTSEWDTAAAQCVLAEAGGLVVDFNGEALQYNAKESLINPAFVAIGDPTQKSAVLALVNELINKRSE